MKRAIQISIPKPCHEDWNTMNPVEKGRHCTVCTKNVIDFTDFSNEQLIKHLDKEKNLCGRFKKSQLNTEVSIERKDKYNLYSYLASVLFTFLTFGSHSAKAQGKPKIEQTTKKFVSLGITNKKIKKPQKITGIIGDTAEGLPGVNIVIKNTSIGTATDFDGNFSLEAKIGDTLVMSYIGYKTQEIIVTQNTINISLEMEEDLQGEIIVLGGAFSTRKKPRRLFYKNPFLYRRWY